MDADKLYTVILSAAVGALVSVVLEYIKNRRAAEFWLAQERWKAKGDTYTNLLSALAETKRQFAVARNAVADAPEDGDEAMLNDAAKRVGELRVRIDCLASVARLWLSKEAVAALEKFDAAHEDAPAMRNAREFGVVAEGVMAEADAAIRLLTTAARADFRL